MLMLVPQLISKTRYYYIVIIILKVCVDIVCVTMTTSIATGSFTMLSIEALQCSVH